MVGHGWVNGNHSDGHLQCKACLSACVVVYRVQTCSDQIPAPAQEETLAYATIEHGLTSFVIFSFIFLSCGKELLSVCL